MKLNDEMLNRYLDGDLSAEELSELKGALEEDEESLQGLKLYKFIEKEIPKLKVYSTPENFTLKVMNKISEGISLKYKKNNFFYYVLASFLTGIFAIIAFVIFNPENISSDKSFFDTAAGYIAKAIPSLSNLSFSNDALLVIGTGLTLVFLLSSFFLFDTHKSIKQKIENYSN